MLLKTDAALLDRVATRLAGPHPYAELSILGWQCDVTAPETAPGTAAWLGALRK